MGRLTRLTGGTVAASEGGTGKRVGLLVLAGVAVLVLVRLLTRGGGEADDGGIDTISTEDEGPETVTIGSDDGESETAEDETDTDTESEADTEETGEGSGISVQAIDRQDLDLFDVVAIVGEALRAAREEYDRRAA